MQKNPELGTIVREDNVYFSLWAPFAQSVSLIGDFNNWERPGIPLERQGDYWAVAINGAQPGQEYKYIILGADNVTRELNDPRALHITASGNSAIVDIHFDWHDQDFAMRPLNEQVVYELHVGTFNRDDPAVPGNFNSVVEKLDYLSGLGITVIELLPCAQMADDRWWGYTPDYPFAVDSVYGGQRAFKRFVDAAHQRGIAVIMDVVYNHLSPDAHLDLWRLDGWYQSNGGGIYFYNDDRGVTPWGATRLDFGRPEVRSYVADTVRMWMADCHVDGLRVDSTHYIRNRLGRDQDPATDIPDGWLMLEEINRVARECRTSPLMIAEDTASNPYITRPETDDGAGFDAQWETPLPFVLRNILNSPVDESRNLQPLIDAILKKYNDDGFQKIVFSESHDADANGRLRMGEEISPGDGSGLFARRRTVLAVALVLTVPGIPMLFQGQEFMQPGSFNHWQKLDWSAMDTFAGNVQMYHDLIALRRNTTGVTKGLLGNSIVITHYNPDDKVLAYHRIFDGVDTGVVVVANFTNNIKQAYELPFPHDGIWKVRFNSDWKGYSDDFTDTQVSDSNAQDGRGKVSLGPYSVLILSLDQ